MTAFSFRRYRDAARWITLVVVGVCLCGWCVHALWAASGGGDAEEELHLESLSAMPDATTKEPFAANVKQKRALLCIQKAASYIKNDMYDNATKEIKQCIRLTSQP